MITLSGYVLPCLAQQNPCSVNPGHRNIGTPHDTMTCMYNIYIHIYVDIYYPFKEKSYLQHDVYITLTPIGTNKGRVNPAIKHLGPRHRRSAQPPEPCGTCGDTWDFAE